jgi:hypothetical protein
VGCRGDEAMNNKYAGMTVNERLFASGLLVQFEQAIKARNAIEIRRILVLVELTEANIKPILDKYKIKECE